MKKNVESSKNEYFQTNNKVKSKKTLHNRKKNEK